MRPPGYGRDAVHGNARPALGAARAARPAATDAPLVIAGWLGQDRVVAGHYNGKIERPRVLSGERLVAEWDFAHEITADGVRPMDRITDRSPNGLHGTTVNTPARAMTHQPLPGATRFPV